MNYCSFSIFSCSFANPAFSLSANVWYIPHTISSVTLLQGVGLSSSIVPSVKISCTALLEVTIAGLGFRHAKTPSGLGKHFEFFLLSVKGLIRLKYFRSVSCYKAFLKCTCMMMLAIDFKKIFSKMLDYFRNF